MDIKDFRKLLFANSQYCTYYNSQENTILAGIMRDFGYKYKEIFSQQKIDEINKNYRKFTTILNSIVGVEIILYVYFVIFPYFIQFMKMPYFIAILGLSVLPLMALYVTYLGVNWFYEDYLKKHIGTFEKVKFQPQPEEIDEKAYLQYRNTSRKSVYVLGLAILLFVLFIFTPIFINKLVLNKKYQSALKLSNAYITAVPINADVYAQRAYAEFKLKKYQAAVKDFENANKYSLSDAFDYQIAGVKTYYLDKASMIKEFDRLIQKEEDEGYKNYLLSQKATYLVKMGDYAQAVPIFNKILAIYEQKDSDVNFDSDAAYYRRAYARSKLGDFAGAKADLTIVENRCATCEYDLETSMVQVP